MTFLRRYYLWPVFQRDTTLTTKVRRLRWVVWGWWTLELRRWYRQRTCAEHDPISVRVGTMREFADGGRGRQRVMCARCTVTLREFSA